MAGALVCPRGVHFFSSPEAGLPVERCMWSTRHSPSLFVSTKLYTVQNTVTCHSEQTSSRALGSLTGKDDSCRVLPRCALVQHLRETHTYVTTAMSSFGVPLYTNFWCCVNTT